MLFSLFFLIVHFFGHAAQGSSASIDRLQAHLQHTDFDLQQQSEKIARKKIHLNNLKSLLATPEVQSNPQKLEQVRQRIILRTQELKQAEEKFNQKKQEQKYAITDFERRKQRLTRNFSKAADHVPSPGHVRPTGAPSGISEELYEKAETGDGDAQFQIAKFYEKGQGVPQNPEQAFQWYKKSAEGGGAKAQYNLGVKYYRGLGTPNNLEEAMKWFEKAAAQNFEPAKQILSTLRPPASPTGLPTPPTAAQDPQSSAQSDSSRYFGQIIRRDGKSIQYIGMVKINRPGTPPVIAEVKTSPAASKSFDRLYGLIHPDNLGCVESNSPLQPGDWIGFSSFQKKNSPLFAEDANLQTNAYLIMCPIVKLSQDFKKN